MICVVATVGIIIASQNLRQNRRLIYYNLLILSALLFIIGYLLEINSTTSEAAMQAVRVQYFGIQFSPPLILLLVGDLCGVNLHKPWAITLLMLTPATILILVMTNEYHHLYYLAYYLSAENAIQVLIPVHGPLWILNPINNFVCLVSSIIILTTRYLTWGKFSRKRIRILLICSVLIVVLQVLQLVGVRFYGLEFGAAASALMLIACWNGLRNYGMLDFVSLSVEKAVATMPESFILIDIDKALIIANKSAYALFPKLHQLKSGQNVFIDAIDVQCLPELIGGDDKVTGFSVSDSKVTKHYEASVNELTTKVGCIGWMLIIRDISETVELTAKLENFAYTDSLTGLYNRRYFFDHARKEFAKASRGPISTLLIMIDVDDFKTVNDRFGHSVGDEVLKGIALSIQETCRAYDLVARFGGEEFIVLAECDNLTAAKIFSERLRECVAKKNFEFDGGIVVKVTVSLGAILIKDSDLSLELAIAEVDKLMYKAKESGKNRCELASSEVLDRLIKR